LVFRIEQSIRDDEKQLGIGPLSRARLAWAEVESRISLADLDAEAEIAAHNDARLALITPLAQESDDD
jgi:hypothetical protein